MSTFEDKHVFHAAPPQFFGEPWPSGICDDGERVPTPVGDVCLLCDELIDEDDRGSFMFDATVRPAKSRPVHRECSLRSVVGGIGHLRGRCSCHGVAGADPDDGLSYRQSALLVWEWVREHGLP